jgi:hypothetical protein
VTVQLIRPEITKAEWHDADGNAVSTGLVGAVLKLHAETKDLAAGAGVRFAVYNSATREKVAEPDVTMNGTTAEAEWTYHYEHDPAHPLKEKPEFYFTADAPRAKKVKSSGVEISQKIKTVLNDPFLGILKNTKYTIITAGTDRKVEGTSDDSGNVEETDLIPGDISIVPQPDEEKTSEPSADELYNGDE